MIAPRLLAVVSATVVVSAAVAVPTADASTPKPVAYKNCAALNHVYRHGVGKPGAKDHVSGHSKPVTTFTRNKAVYLKNTKLDRDKDGVACEKR